MNIEKFYYDEQTEMYEQMKKEQDDNAYRFRHPVIERIVFGICGHFLNN